MGGPGWGERADRRIGGRARKIVIGTELGARVPTLYTVCLHFTSGDYQYIGVICC